MNVRTLELKNNGLDTGSLFQQPKREEKKKKKINAHTMC